MAPQLQINQGPQDALLYDNTRSYFTNVGYVRTSNFQVEYRDVDAQNTAALGSLVQYVIPKAADLLGPVDLRVKLNVPQTGAITGFYPSSGAFERTYAQWVDELGFAMIEKATLSIGSNDIETITGEQMQLKNELMTSDEQRLGFDHIQKTGRRALREPGFPLDETTLLTHLEVVRDQGAQRSAVTADASAGVEGVTAISSASGHTIKFQKCSIAKLHIGTGIDIQVGDLVYAGTTLVGKVNTALKLLTVSGDFGNNDQTLQVTPADGATNIALDGGVVLGVFRPPAPLANEKPGLTGKSPYKDYTRLAVYEDSRHGSALASEERELIIPLAFFFTKHVSQYFPLAAIAGCNDVRIGIKFRALNELIQIRKDSKSINTLTLFPNGAIKSGECKLRCHYVHVTGPEATTLMNKEHVRLMKMWQHQSKVFTSADTLDFFDFQLSFLHPIMSLIIVIRRQGDMTGSVDGADAEQKGYFFYHGDGEPPNYDASLKSGRAKNTVKVSSIELQLNGQERHPGLSKGIDASYLRHRLTPMLHSNSNALDHQLRASSNTTTFEGIVHEDMVAKVDYEMKGSKNVYVYPFSLNPEGSNPSGAVNFSKVSHANLRVHLDKSFAHAHAQKGDATSASDCKHDYVVDVYGLFYNWLQIKDGRALLSFA